jgi:hypothetical protein
MFKGYPLGLSLLSDGRRFATFQQGGPFCVWDDGRPKPRLCMKGTSSPTPTSAVTADASSGRIKGIVSVWDVASRFTAYRPPPKRWVQ